MKLYEIAGREDSELNGMVFGHFTTEDLAEKGHKALYEAFQDETEIICSNLPVNAIGKDDRIIDLTASKSAKEVIASRNEDNYVEGYVQIHISDMIDNDLETFLDLLSLNLVGNELLMDINYDVVGLADEPNTLVLKVRGDVSDVLEFDEEDEL